MTGPAKNVPGPTETVVDERTVTESVPGPTETVTVASQTETVTTTPPTSACTPPPGSPEPSLSARTQQMTPELGGWERSVPSSRARDVVPGSRSRPWEPRRLGVQLAARPRARTRDERAASCAALSWNRLWKGQEPFVSRVPLLAVSVISTSPAAGDACVLPGTSGDLPGTERDAASA